MSSFFLVFLFLFLLPSEHIPETMGPPLDMLTSEVTAHGFRVSWSPAPGNVEKYRVVYYPLRGGLPQEVNACFLLTTPLFTVLRSCPNVYPDIYCTCMFRRRNVETLSWSPEMFRLLHTLFFHYIYCTTGSYQGYFSRFIIQVQFFPHNAGGIIHSYLSLSSIHSQLPRTPVQVMKAHYK